MGISDINYFKIIISINCFNILSRFLKIIISCICTSIIFTQKMDLSVIFYLNDTIFK